MENNSIYFHYHLSYFKRHEFIVSSLLFVQNMSDNLSGKIDSILSQLATNATNVSNILSTIDALRAEIKARDNQIDELSTKVASLEEKVIKQDEEISTLKFANGKTIEELTIKELVDLYLFGDSIINHVDVNDINPDGHNLKTHVRGGTIEDLRREILRALQKYDIREIIIHLGSNNTEFESASYIVYQLVNLVKEIKEVSPTTTVFASNVLPRRINKKPTTDFTKFSDIHRKLQGASKNGMFTLINHFQFFRKVEGKYIQNEKLFTRKDYVHINYKGVELLTGNFVSRHNGYRKQQQRPSENEAGAISSSQVTPSFPTHQTPIRNARIPTTLPFTPIITQRTGVESSAGFQNVQNDTYKRPRRGSV